MIGGLTMGAPSGLPSGTVGWDGTEGRRVEGIEGRYSLCFFSHFRNILRCFVTLGWHAVDMDKAANGCRVADQVRVVLPTRPAGEATLEQLQGWLQSTF